MNKIADSPIQTVISAGKMVNLETGWLQKICPTFLLKENKKQEKQ